MIDKANMYYCADCSGKKSLVFHPSLTNNQNSTFSDCQTKFYTEYLTYSELQQLIKNHVILELGRHFLYIPVQANTANQISLPWIHALIQCGLLTAGPWMAKREWVIDRVAKRHSHLLSAKIFSFKIYLFDKSFNEDMFAQ